MAETKVIKYGDKEMELPANMTLEQGKEQMRRFFPELADPAIETKKEKNRTVYIFSKKAGHKGASKRHVRRKSCEGKIRYVSNPSTRSVPGASSSRGRLPEDEQQETD